MGIADVPWYVLTVETNAQQVGNARNIDPFATLRNYGHLPK
jgi:hypothetical protein